MATSLIPVDETSPNPWNPNMMPGEEYEALKKDMQQVGSAGVGMILVSPAVDFYAAKPDLAKKGGWVIVDGEHRWRIAKELGWKEIRAEVRKISEDDAKAICYRSNREHGNLDPFKEAKLFKSELDNKLTQKDIAEKYLVDPTTVSHRLSLLKLSPAVTEEVEKLPRGTLTVSHLEPVTSLDARDQKQVMDAIIEDTNRDGAAPPVKEISETVERLKKQREDERALQAALEKSKHTRCPKCGKSPKGIYHKGLPWVECSSYNYDHTWNLETGKPFHTPTPTQTGTRAQPLPQTLRSNHTVKEIHAVFAERIKQLYPKIEVEEVRIHGKLNGAKFSFDLNRYSRAMSVSVQLGNQHEGFRAEEHDYKSGEKTTVHCGSPQQVERVKAFIEQVFTGELLQDKTKKEENNEA